MEAARIRVIFCSFAVMGMTAPFSLIETRLDRSHLTSHERNQGFIKVSKEQPLLSGHFQESKR